ncbi:MAG: dihydrolipoyl dehydrogenase [Alphaproteobacteria bacterium]|nr:MAG: dihydrolipoyl dehydrogenase [Alphaproteobacteria bacterium]
MADNAFDLIVIGAGPGGYVAAIRAAQLGLRTAVIEREHLGGICLNWGCIPTKALLRSAEIKHYLDHAGDFGLSAGEVSFDLGKIVKRSRQVAGQLNAGVKTLLKKSKVTTIMGTARLAGRGRVTVRDAAGKTQTLTAKDIIIATGARARELPHLKADGKRIWTYKQAMVPDSLPKRLLVVGSGAIGVEFASFYHDLGAKVTIIEVLDRILPVEDAEISAFAQKQFEKQGMRILTSASVDKLESRSDGVHATVKTKAGKTETLAVDRVILAIGITGNVEDLGLEEAGVRIEKGHIVVDAWGHTGVDGLWAIGDVAGPPWLAHKASHEGVIAVEKIAGVKGLHPLDVQRIPGCTYSRPQVASVGLSEEKAKAAGHKLRVGRFPFIGNGKAIALGEPEGFVKTVFDAETGALLGAHMIGAEVTELIQGYAVAMTLETTEAELMHSVFPHPTLSEMMHESVLAAYGRAIHI